MKKIFFLLFILGVGNCAYSQNIMFDNVWLSGPCKMTFNGFQKPTTDTFSTQNSVYFYATSSGGSNICDSNGNLILMCEGITLHGKDKKFIQNGDSLVPNLMMDFQINTNLSQNSIFLPFPNNQYYLFIPTSSDSQFSSSFSTNTRLHFDLLLANKIDMNANNGNGKVVKKGLNILDHVTLNKTNMMACKHGNGMDWWLLKQGFDSNYVYKFLVTSDSIYNYGTQVFNVLDFGKWDYDGQAMVSQDGTKYAVCNKGGAYPLDTIAGNGTFLGKFMVIDFDRCSGALSNPKVYQAKPGINQENALNGLCFSPNGRFIYVSSYYNIKQLDLWDADTNTQWVEVAGLDTTDNFQGYSNIYLGPDNRLYIGYQNGTSNGLSAIIYPDNKGVACGWSPKYIHFPHNVGPLPCMPNYHLGKMEVCWPLSNEELIMKNEELVVYPNPSSTKIVVRCQMSDVSKELYNSVGQLILSTKENEIDVRNLSKGVYYLKVGNLSRKVLVE